MNFKLLVCAAAAVVLHVDANRATAQSLYWSDWSDQAIKRMNVDGTNVSTIVSLNGQPSGLAVDFNAGKLYWGMWTGADSGKILSANLDGSDQTVISATGALQVWNIAIDQNAVYFNSFGNVGTTGVGKVGRDGTGLTFFTGQNYGEAITLNRDSNLLYFQNQISGNPIYSQDAGGALAATQILTQANGYQDFVGGLAVDTTNQKLYLTDSNASGHRILRSNLDGTNLQLVADVSGLGRLYSLHIDPTNQLIYYGTFGGTIGSVGFDGTNQHVLANQPGLYSFAYELGTQNVPEPTTLVLFAASISGMLIHRRTRKSNSTR